MDPKPHSDRLPGLARTGPRKSRTLINLHSNTDMKIKSLLTLVSLFLLALPVSSPAQGTTFTYQGYLTDAGNGATGIYDLRFSLFDVDSGGVAVAGPLTTGGVAVSNGLFTVTIDFGSGEFDGDKLWLEIGVQTNGGGGFSTLSPRTQITPSPYAIFSTTAGGVPNNTIGSAQVIDNSLTATDLAAGSVGNSEIADGTITTTELNLASVDGRYVLKAGDTMTGPLITTKLTATAGIATSSITNDAGLLSIKSRTDIELTIDNGGGAAAAFEVFNGLGNHLFLLGETGNARTFGNHLVDGSFGVGTTTVDANASAQFNLPNSVSVPHIRIKSALGNNGFGLQFVNPEETWFVGPNIGNWSDDRFNILADNSNRGIIVAANGNVAIDSVSAASPFATLTVDGTIGFPTVTTPAMYVYQSGTSNPDKPLIVHSPAFPGYGLYYSDPGDQFIMRSTPTDTTPSLVVDLDGNWVTIATDTPKPGYELSVNGQVVCEELLVEDMVNWPDYVFEASYPLRPLSEVEAHILAKKHLPGIPTAEEVKRDGLPIGEMQKRMMEKIEELTLYVIDQNKRLATQEQRILELQAQLHARQP